MFVYYVNELLSLGSIHRAGVSASAAIDALVSVDHVCTVTLGDGFNIMYWLKWAVKMMGLLAGI